MYLIINMNEILNEKTIVCQFLIGNVSLDVDKDTLVRGPYGLCQFLIGNVSQLI